MMNQQFRIQPVHIIFAIFEIIFIILFGISVNKLMDQTEQTPEVQISNIFEQVTNLPEDSYTSLERSLYAIVAKNTSADFSIANSGATIRENSIAQQYFTNAKLNYVSFIVDIPSLQQSYQMKYEWGSDSTASGNNSLMAMCLPEERLIYGDFNCQDSYNNRGQEIVVYELSQPSRKVFYVDEYVVSYHNTPYDDDFYIILPVSDCSDNNQKATTAEQEFGSFITKLGFLTSEIPYQAETYCDIDY